MLSKIFKEYNMSHLKPDCMWLLFKRHLMYPSVLIISQDCWSGTTTSKVKQSTCWILWPEGKCFFPYLFHCQEYKQYLCCLRMRSSSVVHLIFSFPIIIVGDDQLTAIVAGNLLSISCLRQQAVQQQPASFNNL